MPAKLIITTGDGEEREVWIEEEVLRIGSQEGCQVRVSGPGVPAHAATIEYRDRAYLLHNRTDEVLALDGTEIAPRKSGKWAKGAELQLGDQVTLRLHIEGDPAPSRRPTQSYALDEEEIEEEPEPDETEETEGEKPKAAKKKSARTYQLVVVVACLLLLPILLFIEPVPPPTVARRDIASEFQSLIQGLSVPESAKIERPGYLREVLQMARLTELRNESELATRWYEEIKNELLLRRKDDNTFPSELEQKVFDFVRNRIEELRPKT